MKLPVYEFRPFVNTLQRPFWRYADGLWKEDDGEYDLAFIGTHIHGFPICLYVEDRYHRNILCSWVGPPTLSNKTGFVEQPKHPGRNPWHYALQHGEKDWGEVVEYWNHPNRIAADSGSTEMSRRSRCCNGRRVEFRADDMHIAAGLLRNRETGKVFQWPRYMKCMYCRRSPYPLIEATKKNAQDIIINATLAKL